MPSASQRIKPPKYVYDPVPAFKEPQIKGEPDPWINAGLTESVTKVTVFAERVLFYLSLLKMWSTAA